MIILTDEKCKYIKILLSKIGKNSFLLWLIHSFLCYHWIQAIIYSPKYSIFICILLIFLSYIISIILEKFISFLDDKKLLDLNI